MDENLKDRRTGRSESFNVPFVADYSYDADLCVATFRDGVKYTVHEMIAIAKTHTTDRDRHSIHAIKKLFDGVIITGTERSFEDARAEARYKLKSSFYERNRYD